jgi:hypothetical protein
MSVLGQAALFLFGGEIIEGGALVYDTIAGGGEAAEGAASFFEGSQYTDKVFDQLGIAGEMHSFPESVAAFEDAGTVSTVVGGDGVQYQMLEIPGSYLSSNGTWYDGAFQFMKDSDGDINHRFFFKNPGP